MATLDEIVVRFRTEGGEEVEDAFRRVGDSAGKVEPALRRVGLGFDDVRLKSERGVTSALRGFVQDASSARSASDILALGLFRLGDAFRGSLLLAGVAAGGAILFRRISDDSKAADLSVKKLSVDLASMATVAGPEKIVAQIQRVSAELEEAATKADTFGNKVRNLLDASVNPLLGTSSRGTGASQAATIAAGQRRLQELAERRISAERQSLDIQRDAFRVDSLLAAEAKVRLSIAEKQAAVDDESKQRRLELFDLTRRGLLSPQARDSLINADLKAAIELKKVIEGGGDLQLQQLKRAAELKGKETQHESELNDISLSTLNTETKKIAALANEVAYRKQLLGLAQTFEEKSEAAAKLLSSRSALADALKASPNTGQLADPFRGLNPAEKVAKYQQLETAARDKFIQSVDDERAKQIADMEQARVHGFDSVGDYRDWKKEMNVAPELRNLESLSGLDFTGLMGLSQMDFTGLKPLDGLTVKVQ